MKLREGKQIFISISLCLSAGFVGSIFTTPSIPTWYAGINKPSFNPPGWIFGPVWTILYIFMGVSLYLVWKNGINKKNKPAIIVFAAQLFLNILWSFLFFKLQSPLLAFIEIVVLWLMILATIIKFQKLSQTAARLLFPYLFWVSFAAILNYSIYSLNR